MKWSFKFGRSFGIGVHLRFTFFLVLGFLGFSQGLSTRQPVMILDGVLTRDIAPYPIGGVARAVSVVLAGSQADFPVVSQGSVAGMLTRDDLMEALAKARPAVSVGRVMRRDSVAVEPDALLEHLLHERDPQSPPLLPVIQHGRLVGLLTMENIGELVMIRSAWDQRHNAATA